MRSFALMANLCTSVVNTAIASLPTTCAETSNDSPCSLTLSTAVPLVLGVLITSLKIALRRARLVAKRLDEDTKRIWSGGGAMLDCSDKEFHQYIIRSAVDRGTAALETISTSHITHASAPEYYQSNSTSGESSENEDDSNFSSIENESTGHCPPKPKPKIMSTQVGGMSSHRRPMMILDRFILKPLRLPVHFHQNTLSRKGRVDNSTMSVSKTDKRNGAQCTTNDYKDGINDQTKAYRGIREVAFYEAVKFASSLPKDLCGFLSEVSHHVDSKESHCAGISNDQVRQAVVLPSLYKSAAYKKSPTNPSLYVQLIQSCRRPCIGHHDSVATTASISSVRSHPILNVSNYLASNFFLPDLGCFNAMTILAAYHAGDPEVLASVQSYIRSWCTLIKELTALKRLSHFVPPYFGVVGVDSLKQDGNLARGPHLLLKNITDPFSHPNIIDIKMGTQTYEPTAPLSKQTREEKKYPQQSEIGFRIVGMRVHRPSAGGEEYQCWDKSFGVNLKTREDVMKALMLFFNCGRTDIWSSCHTSDTLSRVLQQLSQIKSWFETENDTLAFYASSILIVCNGSQNLIDGDAEIGGSKSCVCQEPIVQMVDFAHVCREARGDTGYLKGVTSLLHILEEIHKVNFQ